MTYFINKKNVNKFTVSIDGKSCVIIIDADADDSNADGSSEEVFSLSSDKINIFEHDDMILIETE